MLGGKEVECCAVWFCPRNQGHHDSNQETVIGRFDWLVTALIRSRVQGPCCGGPQKALYCAAVPDALREKVSAGTPKASFVLLGWKAQWFLTSLQCRKLLYLSSSWGWGEDASEHPGSQRLIKSISEVLPFSKTQAAVLQRRAMGAVNGKVATVCLV